MHADPLVESDRAMDIFEIAKVGLWTSQINRHEEFDHDIAIRRNREIAQYKIRIEYDSQLVT
jgi:hypothetical protein